MNEPIISATVDIIEQLLGHDSPQPEVIAALERVLAGRRREVGMGEPTRAIPIYVHEIECTALWPPGEAAPPLWRVSIGRGNDARHFDFDDEQTARNLERAILTAIPQRTDTREAALREAAEIARQIAEMMHRQIGGGLGPAADNRFRTAVTIGTDIAGAILAAIPSPPPPQSGERERLKAELRDEAKRIRENGSTIMTKFDWADAKQEGRCRQLAAMYLEEFADCMEMQDDAMRAREGE